jgi:Flp pilus assembly protein protease CpaA
MQIFTFATLVWIGWFDLRTHRIPNSALIVLLLLSLFFQPHGSEIGEEQFLVAATALVVGILLWRFCGLGMGDVKLIFIVALVLMPASLDSYLFFTSVFWIIASIHLLAQALILRSISQPLPLAPSIVLAYISFVYLK